MFNQSGFVKNRFTVYILCLFEEMGGLKIIFHKSDIYCFGEALDKSQQYSDIFTCPVSCLPMKYLGILIDKKRLSNSLRKPVEDKFEKKKWGLARPFLSLGGRLVLINSSLSNAPLYMLYLFRVPKGVAKRKDFFRARLCCGRKVKG